MHFHGRWFIEAEADAVLAGGDILQQLQPVELHPTLTGESKK